MTDLRMTDNRCPQCGRLFYKKKGYNSNSLKNLVNYRHKRKPFNTKHTNRQKNKCMIDNCNNKRFVNSILCLEHYNKRSIQNDN